MEIGIDYTALLILRPMKGSKDRIQSIEGEYGPSKEEFEFVHNLILREDVQRSVKGTEYGRLNADVASKERKSYFAKGCLKYTACGRKYKTEYARLRVDVASEGRYARQRKNSTYKKHIRRFSSGHFRFSRTFQKILYFNSTIVVFALLRSYTPFHRPCMPVEGLFGPVVLYKTE